MHMGHPAARLPSVESASLHQQEFGQRRLRQSHGFPAAGEFCDFLCAFHAVILLRNVDVVNNKSEKTVKKWAPF